MGDRGFVDETDVKVTGVWRFIYWVVDRHGQVVDAYVAQLRDVASDRGLFTTALTAHEDPSEVVTDRALARANVIEDVTPAVMHTTGQGENTPASVTTPGQV